MCTYIILKDSLILQIRSFQLLPRLKRNCQAFCKRCYRFCQIAAYIHIQEQLCRGNILIFLKPFHVVFLSVLEIQSNLSKYHISSSSASQECDAERLLCIRSMWEKLRRLQRIKSEFKAELKSGPLVMDSVFSTIRNYVSSSKRENRSLKGNGKGT